MLLGSVGYVDGHVNRETQPLSTAFVMCVRVSLCVYVFFVCVLDLVAPAVSRPVNTLLITWQLSRCVLAWGRVLHSPEADVQFQPKWFQT